MNRTIEFRGQRKSDKQWLYGDLVHRSGQVFIFPEIGYDSPDNYEVIPETVGQYTSFSDYYMAKIFSGDILENVFNKRLFRWEVGFNDGSFCIRYLGLAGCKYEWIKTSQTSFFQRVIVGNIHEHTELLNK
jgi:hypothetical protein